MRKKTVKEIETEAVMDDGSKFNVCVCVRACMTWNASIPIWKAYQFVLSGESSLSPILQSLTQSFLSVLFGPFVSFKALFACRRQTCVSCLSALRHVCTNYTSLGIESAASQVDWNKKHQRYGDWQRHAHLYDVTGSSGPPTDGFPIDKSACTVWPFWLSVNLSDLLHSSSEKLLSGGQ